MQKTTVTTPDTVTFPWRVTPEQLDRCSRILDCQTNTVFYLVLSESDPTQEYRVEWRDGWTCTCPSGQIKFANVQHPSGVCKHVRWATCAEIEYRHELRARAQAEARQQQLPTAEPETHTTSYHDSTRAHLLISNGQEASDQEYSRVMNAKPYEPSEAEIKRDQARYQSTPFSLLK